ncbi:hypothetical protein Tco_0554855 [Tanacetum coccineum]
MEYSASVVVSGAPGDRSHVHTHDHDGSEAPDESPGSILSNEPSLGRKHNLLSTIPILSPGESFPIPLYDPSVDSPTVIGAISGLPSAGSTHVSAVVTSLPISISRAIVAINLLREGCQTRVYHPCVGQQVMATMDRMVVVVVVEVVVECAVLVERSEVYQSLASDGRIWKLGSDGGKTGLISRLTGVGVSRS